ncbi:MAG: septum formation initiator family protein [Alphaproteobacteria bacterium]|jgi:cell division protein FtsB|nr:septum formation initiator family protein [Alphaproteobacteria bacterium]
MSKLFNHRIIIRENLISLIGMCLVLYFTYHAIYGSRSLMQMMSLKSQIETMSSERDKLAAERESLEQRVSMMRPGSLDRDLLEERARVVLGYKNQNEMIILGN